MYNYDVMLRLPGLLLTDVFGFLSIFAY